MAKIITINIACSEKKSIIEKCQLKGEKTQCESINYLLLEDDNVSKPKALQMSDAVNKEQMRNKRVMKI